MSADLILLHPPSVYDFRKKTILYGPVSDLIPSSFMFELYPIGFTSIAEYLEKAGYRVRIANIAVRVLNDENFDAEALIKRLKAPLFGIDLHWLVSSHGAIEIARIVKKYHPDSKVIFGGFSATYFYRELVDYPEVDFVMRGDSTEEPLRQLMACLKEGRSPEAVPNLVWRDEKGEVRENPFTKVATDLSDVMVNHYANTVRSVIKYRDLANYTPFSNWKEYPITAVLTCRGCRENCVVCGGSAFTGRNFYNRQQPVFRTPEQVVKDVKQISRFIGGPIFILGDLRQSGDDYAHEVLRLLKKAMVKNQIILELFSPAPRELLAEMSDACPDFCLEISPESHDPKVAKAAGRLFSSENLEQTLSDALDVGCGRLDVFFMIGIPRQTAKSVMETIDYCEHLFKKFNGDKRVSLFIAPLSPFLDPGSLGFEQSDRHGYKVLFHSLEEHRQALVEPSWKYSLNFETKWLSRDELVDVSYEAILRLNSLKAKYGIIPQAMAKTGEERLRAAWAMAKRIDDMMAHGATEEEIAALKPEIDAINNAPVMERKQLEFHLGRGGLKFVRSLWAWLTGRW